VRNPKVFCMDEPLSNLDAKLRVSTRSQIAGLQRRLGITTVYVTHDQVEAMTMGHRVAVLRDGRLQQVGTPEELYDRPVNTFVASFIGSPAITLVEAQLREGVAEVHGARIPLDRDVAAKAGAKVVVGLRPESWHLVDAGADNGVDLKVELVEALGSESFIYGVPVGAEQEDGVASQRVTVHSDKRVRPEVGEVVHVVPEPSEAHVFSAETGERLTSA
jgi:sn-glycerol 3-phosphate transport system ATP-binding protein/multiple sugar transport system ATP-binding protein